MGIPCPSEVRDGLQENVYTVPELPETSVAVEAQQAADVSVLVAVVHVLGGVLPADGAQPALLLEHAVGVLRADAVAALQVVGPGTPVKALVLSLPRALWHGLQYGCRPLGWFLFRGNSERGSTSSQSRHRIVPSGSTSGGRRGRTRRPRPACRRA